MRNRLFRQCWKSSMSRRGSSRLCGFEVREGSCLTPLNRKSKSEKRCAFSVIRTMRYNRFGRFRCRGFIWFGRENGQVLRLKYYPKGGDFSRNQESLNLTVHCHGITFAPVMEMTEPIYNNSIHYRLIGVLSYRFNELW